ncbi:MAG: oligoendopeptidase F [Eubacteriaceae bacterium]|nr:oligoendopeptidase F [Eubacteriaceae bacterium]
MKNRQEMDPRYMWDFTQLYSDSTQVEKAFSELGEEMTAIDGLLESMEKDRESFIACLDGICASAQKAEKLAIYGMLSMSADSTDPASQELEDRSRRIMVSFSERMSVLESRLGAMDEDVLDSFMDCPQAEKYAHFVDNIRRFRPHMLSEEMEVFLAKLSDFAGTPDNVYSMFTDSDLTFPDTHGDDGEPKTLTNGNFNIFRESRSRQVREEAFNNYLGQYGRYINTFAVLYSSMVKFDNLNAETRKYSSAMESALFANDIPPCVYTNLVSSVHNRLGAMKKYTALRKKALGLGNIDMFDLYVPMVADVDMNVPFGEARDLIKAALAPLGDEYLSLLDRAFDEKWMDVYENKGKRSGAFSCGVYGVHPFVLLNYTDTLDDAYTVAHELGHSMHSFFSDRAQEFVNHDYSIFVAEVASTVNEVLLTLYLLEKETEPSRRASILNKFAEGFRTTVYRQTLFAEFEQKAHEAAAAGTALNAQNLCSIYRGLVETYYEGAGVPDVMKYEWSYIPHFYSPFYVYQYATGFSSAVAIARRIRETGDASGYLKFLSLGGSVYPVEALKTAGVDLTLPDAVDDALALFEQTVDELEQLL